MRALDSITIETHIHLYEHHYRNVDSKMPWTLDSIKAYKIPAAQIDGMNLVDVRNATIDSLKRIRSGSGPVFLEAMTYRFHGHSVSDPSAYRERAEVEEWKLKDPIERFKLLSLKEKLITEEEISLIDDEIRNTVEESVHFAEESPSPDPDSILDNVYS